MAWSEAARAAAIEARKRKGAALVTIGHGKMQTQVTRNSRAAYLRMIRTTPAVRIVPFRLRKAATHATATVVQVNQTRAAVAFMKRGGPSSATKSAMAARERLAPSSELVGSGRKRTHYDMPRKLPKK